MISDVINGGYCIGCGACAAISGSPFDIRMTAAGCYEAYLSHERPTSTSTIDVNAVCPFSDATTNEDAIAARVFDGLTTHHVATGFYESCFAGYVAEGDYRSSGSSGGMGSWLLCELLAQNAVDYVIHVGAIADAAPGSLLFGYRISSTASQIQSGAKSKYYPVEMSRVLADVRRTPGRYVLVGVPCFIKAARLLCETDPILRDRLRWFVGLVCGHLKSRRFAELLAWQMGIPPRQLTGFDFRVKIPSEPASSYGVEAWGRDGDKSLHVMSSSRQLYGTDWGHGFFKYKACDYCDDVFAETADVVIGDAWLPRYKADPKGTNIIIVRNAKLGSIFRKAQSDGRLYLEELSPGSIAASQAAGLRHRRDGLAYRVARTQRRRLWAPRKRHFAGTAGLSAVERKRQDLRERVRDESHRAFETALRRNDLVQFVAPLVPLTETLNKMKSAWPQRVAGRFRRLLKRLLKASTRTVAIVS
jgi:coenzyme F420-reducing hydrogenase beta subunit